MRSQQYKILLGGLAVLLILSACGTVSTVPPTVPASKSTASPVPLTATPAVSAVQVVSSPAIQHLDMLDDNNGWAVSEIAILRTSDGGSTWHNATPPGLSGALASSFFLDTTTGWVAIPGADPTSGTLYHTTDGGVTWTSATVPFDGGSIKFVDPLHGWELIGLSAAMSHEAVAIFRTSDGGTTWSQVFVNDPGASGSGNSLPLVGDKNGIAALDANRGWVTGAQPSGDFIYIYATQDGGTTWAHQDLSMPAGYSGAMTSAGLPVFFGASDAVLPVQLFANNSGSDFYVSHNGGQTWTVTTPVAQGGIMAVASASDFFVWDGSASLNISRDAGASWSTVTPNVNLQGYMVSMQFVNVTTGWVLTSDANSHYSLYKTSDGGSTWNILIP